MSERRKFDSLLRGVGADPEKMKKPEEHPGDKVDTADIVIEQVDEDSLSLQSVDVLRDRQLAIEETLQVAFSSLSDAEREQNQGVFYTVLSPTFWMRLERKAEQDMAEEYDRILKELKNREVAE